MCDVVCTGRFHNRPAQHGGRWGLLLRQRIYEKDRLDPLAPGATPALDPDLLARFPEGYRHLANPQARDGMTVRPDLPDLRGPAAEAVKAAAAT